MISHFGYTLKTTLVITSALQTNSNTYNPLKITIILGRIQETIQFGKLKREDKWTLCSLKKVNFG